MSRSEAASPQPPKLCRKAASLFTATRPTQVPCGQERWLFPLEQHCCIPGLACSFKLLGSIQPSPLSALQEVGGTANPPEKRSSRPEQTHLQNYTGPSLAPSTQKHTFLSRHIFVHLLLFKRPKNFMGRNLSTPKTQTHKAPCLWELSLGPSRENHSSLQWLRIATTAWRPKTPSPQCLDKGARIRASPCNMPSHCPGKCQASH